MRCTIAMRQICHLLLASSPIRAEFFLSHLRIGIVIESDDPAALVVVARRTDKRRNGTGPRIGDKIDEFLVDLSAGRLHETSSSSSAHGRNKNHFVLVGEFMIRTHVVRFTAYSRRIPGTSSLG